MGAKKKRVVQEPGMDMTPVIDMSFLLIVFFLCLPFKALDAKLAAALPVHQGIVSVPVDLPNEMPVEVRIVPPRFGKSFPCEYRCGDFRTTDMDEVGRWMARQRAGAKAAGFKDAVGHVDADRRTPHKFVIAVVNEFIEQGYTDVRFEGTRSPSPEVRRMSVLPPPR